jgi:hypothetical protein
MRVFDRALDYGWGLMLWITFALAGVFATHEFFAAHWLYEFVMGANCIANIRTLGSIAIDPVIAILVLNIMLLRDAVSFILAFVLISLRCSACHFQKSKWVGGCIFSCALKAMRNALTALGSFLGWNFENYFSVQNLLTILIILFMLQGMYKNCSQSNSGLRMKHVLVMLIEWLAVYKVSGIEPLQFTYLTSFTFLMFHMIASKHMDQDLADRISKFLMFPDVKEIISFLFRMSFTFFGFAIYSGFGAMCGDCMINSVLEKLVLGSAGQLMQTCFMEWVLSDMCGGMIEKWLSRK